ncbi:MAG: 3-oxoacyl-[acyl-carrier-protein] synthase III C-terminal domain-containing protein [Pseudomonadales bacterium]|jgi:3-oxoacyl-[acyl-carrier-protein] synthase-3
MSRIEATGRYMPEKVVTNGDFSDGPLLFETVQEFFNGFKERRHAGIGETGISMAAKAAKDALSCSQYLPENIDLIIGAILPNENLYGEDLNLLQYELGAINASVLPINTTCSSFLSALNIADSLIAAGKKKCVLVVIATNWVNTALNIERPNYGFAGDGSAAVILDGKADSLIDVNEKNNSTPAVFESMLMKSPVFSGDKEYFTITEPEGVSTAKDLVMAPIEVGRKLLERNSDIRIDKVFMHQAGLKMMHLWASKLGIEPGKIRHTLELYANMTASNIPVSLDYWVKNGGLERGDTLLFFSPAAGGHYIAMLWQY